MRIKTKREKQKIETAIKYDQSHQLYLPPCPMLITQIYTDEVICMKISSNYSCFVVTMLSFQHSSLFLSLIISKEIEYSFIVQTKTFLSPLRWLSSISISFKTIYINFQNSHLHIDFCGSHWKFSSK